MAAASSRLLPIPGSPSISTVAGWPDAIRSRASPRASISAARPRSRGGDVNLAMIRMLLRIRARQHQRFPRSDPIHHVSHSGNKIGITVKIRPVLAGQMLTALWA